MVYGRKTQFFLGIEENLQKGRQPQFLVGHCPVRDSKENKLEWAELNQAETVRLHVYAKLRFQV